MAFALVPLVKVMLMGKQPSLAQKPALDAQAFEEKRRTIQIRDIYRDKPIVSEGERLVQGLYAASPPPDPPTRYKSSSLPNSAS